MSEQNNYYGQPQNPYYPPQAPYYPPQPGQPMTHGQVQVPYGQAPQYYQAPPAAQYTYGQQPYYPQPVPGQQMPPQQMPPQTQQPVYYQPAPTTAAPYAQPYYAPQPMQTPVADSGFAQGEVIRQESMFADYGFGSEDTSASGRDFGGLMQDDNSSDESSDDSLFNSPTPNFDIAEVEANAKADSGDNSIFTSTTPNLDIAAVEAASVLSEEDKEIFSNTTPILPVSDGNQIISIDVDSETAPVPAVAPSAFTNPEPVVQETTVAAEPVTEFPNASINFMASMQSMFSSMSQGDTPVPPEPVAPVVPEPVAPVVPQPVVEQPVYQQPDTVIKNSGEVVAQANTIQDISNAAVDNQDADKGPEYWAYMNQLLNNFDDGQVHAEISQPSYVVETPAPVVPEPVDQPVYQQPVVDQPVYQQPVPVAPVASAPQPPRGIFIKDMSAPEVESSQTTPYMQDVPMQQPVAPVAIQDDSDWASPENIDDKSLKQSEKAAAKAAKAEQKAALAAAKSEKKAAAKAEKERLKAEKKNKAVEDVDEAFTDDSEGDVEPKSKFKRIISAIFPVAGDSVKEIIRKIVAIVAVIVFIGCMIKLATMYFGTRSNQKSSDELAGIMTSAEKSEYDWNAIYNKYPSVQFPSGMQAKFADLYAMNQDLVGWVRISGLNIDFPVVQTDNDSYYLKHNFRKESSDYGTVFVSATNNIENLDLNTVVYGHSMRRDTQMFTALKEYKDVEGFKENPIIEFNTLYKDYKFKVYAVFISNGSTAGDNGYVFNYTFQNLADVETFAGFIGQINQRTLYKTGVDIKPDDKLITLSTCTYEFKNARLVVIGRLVRDGESEEVDTSKVEINKNPRYPQAWYDANNVDNPYAGQAQWVPKV